MELLVERQQQSLLLSLTLTKFTGDPLKFFTVVHCYEWQIEVKVRSNAVCLQYLEQYPEGEPERAYQRKSSSGSRQWLFRSEDAH